MPPTTRVFHYDAAPVRVRVRGGEPVWFTRDLAAALGVRFPPGPLLPASENSLPGMATAAQVWTVVERAGCGAPDAFRAWMTEVSTRILARPVPTPASVARPAHPASLRRTHTA
ncbi:BRO-N domain-containing protein [Streptomyces rimosus]|uniref:hypothetical protein n=1 Tax=Streptomyces rimosus TaxID=1927 RepID=UPI0004C09B07|nr:hypothetical protein [Streptomyces rimosus]